MDGLVDLVEDEIIFIKSAADIFIRAFYWGVNTLVTTGFGDLSAQSYPEILVSIPLFFAGYVGICFLIAVLTNMMQETNAAESDFLRKMDELTKYMNYRHLPREIQTKIRYSYNYFWELLRGMNEESFLCELPSTLYTEVTMVLTLRLLA